MDLLTISKEQESKLKEMCADLFPECERIKFAKVGQTENLGKNDTSVVLYNGSISTRFHWYQLCAIEIPKRLAMNSTEVEENIAEKQWFYCEMMAKKMLAIHPLYKDKQVHPVDYLYEEFKKI